MTLTGAETKDAKAGDAETQVIFLLFFFKIFF